MRKLGRTGIIVSEMGLGCFSIGGPFTYGGSLIDLPRRDAEAIRAIHLALDRGITLFDTADIYSAGHSEVLLGQAIAGRRSSVVVATKFGFSFDEATRTHTGQIQHVADVRAACAASLRRLQTDYIDLYQLHHARWPMERIPEMIGALEDLVAAGWIRAYGWSTGDPERSAAMAQGAHFAAVQHDMHLFLDDPAVLAVCDQHDLASINRIPLARGLLADRVAPGTLVDGAVLRARAWEPAWLERLGAVRAVLTREGHSMSQAALRWLLQRHPRTVPIPGFSSVKQVEENLAALDAPPLSHEQMADLDRLLRH